MEFKDINAADLEYYRTGLETIKDLVKSENIRRLRHFNNDVNGGNEIGVHATMQALRTITELDSILSVRSNELIKRGKS